MAWKNNETVHYASDYSLAVTQSSFADVGIKIPTLPITIYDPAQENNNAPRTVVHNAVLGMCFAGSAVNSLTIKESITEILKSLQHLPGYTDIGMDGIASFVFNRLRTSQLLAEIIITDKQKNLGCVYFVQPQIMSEKIPLRSEKL